MADKNYLCFEALENTTIKFSATGQWTNMPVIYYSLDASTWTEYTFGTNISLTAEQKCYWKGDNNSFSQSSITNTYITFGSTNMIKASGNIMSLLDSTCESTTISSAFCFVNLFRDCSGLVSAPELPATTLSMFCYGSMFYGCKALKTPPELPATTLAGYCYYGMFYGCTSLKLSETQSDNFTTPYRIPTDGVGTTAQNALDDMFTGTGGTFTGTPAINTTYYYGLNIKYIDKVNVDNKEYFINDSSKQPLIIDLDSIRHGASLGATAVQKIKTINNNSLIGSGNIDIESGTKLTLNGSSTTSASIYAPTTYGTAGYDLVSKGTNAAPVWVQPTNYLNCSTTGSTSTKTVSCSNFVLTAGKRVVVRFTYAHTSSYTATLKVGSTDSRTMYWASTGAAITSSNSWKAGEYVDCIYTGSNWYCTPFGVDLSSKQDTLVSGTNIKTINNNSLLGNGDIDLKYIFGTNYDGTSLSLRVVKLTTAEYEAMASHDANTLYIKYDEEV